MLTAVILWGYAAGCTPQVQSILHPESLNGTPRWVTSPELKLEYDTFLLRYEYAVGDLEMQAERASKITQAITTLATGGVAYLPGLLQVLLGAGVLSLVADDVRLRRKK